MACVTDSALIMLSAWTIGKTEVNHLYDLTRFGSFLWIIIMTKMAVYLDTSVTKIERKPTAVLVSIEPMANPGSTRLPHTAWDGRLKSGISTVSSLPV